MNKQLLHLLYLIIPFVFATWVYAPALFHGKTQIHGDSIAHGISVLEFNHKMLHESISPLWTNLLYGGHPFFAEAQGGFLNPLNLAIALFFDPIAGLNYYQWFSILLGALGMYFLCRFFQLSAPAATFGSLAVIFSPYWLSYHDNVTVSGALCWIPWVILCYERWIEHPTLKRASWLALAVSVLIFAGYPLAFHGAIIYMAVSLIPTIICGYIGSRKDNLLKQYVQTGIVAIVLCIGLSAVQVLPLFELTAQSIRSGGIDIFAPVPLNMYIRGFLFTYLNAKPEIAYIGTIGSVFICFIASLSLSVKMSHRIVGTVMATVLLIILGLEYNTPFFEFFKKHHLLPGLNYFRIVHLYIGISAIGFGILGAFAIDSIQKFEGKLLIRDKYKLIHLGIVSALFLIFSGLVISFKSADAPKLIYGTFIASYILLIIHFFFNKVKWFGHAMLILIVLEIFFLRITPFPFVDSHICDKPEFVRHIESDIRSMGYRILDISLAGAVGFIYPWNPNLERAVSKFIRRSCANSNVLWEIPSMDADLALPLARRKLIQPKLMSEISGEDSAPPGSRLIDYLAIRFINVDNVSQTVGFEPFYSKDITIMKNSYAFPRIQTFTRYEMADSIDDALDRLKQSRRTTLILEPPFSETIDTYVLPKSTDVNAPDALTILSSEISNTRYYFEVNAIQPAWLFIADANYPGWQASIDGQPTAVYTGQVLGKAVFVPPGSHQITIFYKSQYFRIGFISLLFSVLILMAICLKF